MSLDLKHENDETLLFSMLNLRGPLPTISPPIFSRTPRQTQRPGRSRDLSINQHERSAMKASFCWGIGNTQVILNYNESRKSPPLSTYWPLSKSFLGNPSKSAFCDKNHNLQLLFRVVNK